jgi:hypothetical protein
MNSIASWFLVIPSRRDAVFVVSPIAVYSIRCSEPTLPAITLIRVLTDRVAVTNLVTHKHVTVEAGHSYLAKAPGRRGH